MKSGPWHRFVAINPVQCFEYNVLLSKYIINMIELALETCGDSW